MTDLVYVILTLACFAGLAVLVHVIDRRLVERDRVAKVQTVADLDVDLDEAKKPGTTGGAR